MDPAPLTDASPWTWADDPADPSVGAVDVQAEASTAAEASRLRELGWSTMAIAAELHRQRRPLREIADACGE